MKIQKGTGPIVSRSFRATIGPRTVATLVFLLLLRGTSIAETSLNPFTKISRTEVSVVQPDQQTSWIVRKAYVEEQLTATTGYLEIRNASNRALKNANFYAEYYDAAGRFCFSLVFSLNKNLEKQEGPLKRQGIRRLYSIGAFLAPASEPKELRVSLLGSGLSEVASGEEKRRPIRAPITMEVRTPAEPDQLTLGPEIDVAKGPVLDLVLARVAVSRSGRSETVDVLGAESESIKSWFLRFVTNQVFYTATTDGVPQAGNILLLLRAVVSGKPPGGVPFLPASASPWMANYVSESADQPLPPITEIIFARPPSRVKMRGTTSWTNLPKPPFGLFEPLTGSSEWSPGIFTMIPDPNSPNHFRRELARPSEP